MDKEKQCEASDHALPKATDARLEKPDKHSNFFKEPEGMTTICLSDVPITNKRKFSEKFKIVTGNKRYTKLFGILIKIVLSILIVGIILVLLIFSLDEDTRVTTFQNATLVHSNPLCLNNTNNMPRACFSKNKTNPEEYISVDISDDETITSKIATQAVHIADQDGSTELENSISGSLVINPHFLGVVAPHLDDSDEGPTNILDVLNIFHYVLEDNKLERQKRSQQKGSKAYIPSPSLTAAGSKEIQTELHSTTVNKIAINSEYTSASFTEPGQWKESKSLASNTEKISVSSTESVNKYETRNPKSDEEVISNVLNNTQNETFLSNQNIKSRIVNKGNNINSSSILLDIKNLPTTEADNIKNVTKPTITNSLSTILSHEKKDNDKLQMRDDVFTKTDIVLTTETEANAFSSSTENHMYDSTVQEYNSPSKIIISPSYFSFLPTVKHNISERYKKSFIPSNFTSSVITTSTSLAISTNNPSITTASSKVFNALTRTSSSLKVKSNASNGYIEVSQNPTGNSSSSISTTIKSIQNFAVKGNVIKSYAALSTPSNFSSSVITTSTSVETTTNGPPATIAFSEGVIIPLNGTSSMFKAKSNVSNGYVEVSQNPTSNSSSSISTTIKSIRNFAVKSNISKSYVESSTPSNFSSFVITTSKFVEISSNNLPPTTASSKVVISLSSTPSPFKAETNFNNGYIVISQNPISNLLSSISTTTKSVQSSTNYNSSKINIPLLPFLPSAENKDSSGYTKTYKDHTSNISPLVSSTVTAASFSPSPSVFKGSVSNGYIRTVENPTNNFVSLVSTTAASIKNFTNFSTKTVTFSSSISPPPFIVKSNVTNEYIKMSKTTLNATATSVKVPTTTEGNGQSSLLKEPLDVIVGMKERRNLESQQNIESSFAEEMQGNHLKGNQLQCAFPSMGYPMLPFQYYPPPFPPYPYPFSQDDQLKIVNFPLPRQKEQIVIVNPPVVNYGPPYMMSPQNFLQVGSSYGSFPSAGPVQTMDPKGQFYMCNPIPAPLPQVATLPGVEIRKTLNHGLLNKERTISHRTPLECPFDHVSCLDNSRCIKESHICDGEADCKDGSDESNCTCKDRIEMFRRCDGYIDCPEGEDEIGCFGCSRNEFSCNDWNPRYRRSTCIPLEQRCDGIKQCPIGFDEMDCSVLTDELDEHKKIKVSNAVGFLNRNFKGKWYPTCFGTEIWAAEICKTESGPNPHHLIPESRLIKSQGNYKGPYIEESQNEGLHLKEKCAMEGSAAFVRCPPLICGMRLKIHNPYRMEEVETSNEILEEIAPDRLHFDDILGDSRIVGGDGSQPASWPWVVTMYKNGVFHCSGVIINEWWIISAAHCVDKYWLYYYEIQAGVLRRFSFAPQTQVRWITHAIPFPSYNKTTLQHDISLLKLSAPLRYNRYVRPICLPSETTAGSDYFNAPYPGTECTVVGWGSTSEHSADPDHLREVRVPVLPVCKYEEDRETNAICAGFSEGGRDACQGDSGGPFMCLNPNHPHQWYLAGVVSHGEGCARPNEPGIYTRVSLYVEWIMEYVNSQQSLPPQTPLQECPGYVCRDTNRCISKKRHCDKMVDCLHGDDEVNCHRWNLDEYFKHLEYETERDSDDVQISNENIGGSMDLIVRKAPNLESQSYENRRFICKSLLQHIPQKKVCDRITDCEDGTDEIGCTCKDYLLTRHPTAICDGVTDCVDLSDEANCECKSSEFQCRFSKRCISLKKRCDGNVDCPHQEDEWDCLALTNGTTISLDVDNRPELRSSGIVASNYRGTWRVTCTSQNESEKQARTAAFMCSYLGFNDYNKFKIFPNNRLRSTILKPLNNHSHFIHINGKENCTLFYVKCSREITHPKMEHFFIPEGTLEEQFYTPWIARIHVNGIYQCAGVLIDLSWVLTSSDCFKDKLHNQSFITVLLGTGKANLQVTGPHEQIIPIGNHYSVPNSIAILLKLYYPSVYTRYVRPINLNTRVNNNRENCIASEANKQGNIKTVKLKSKAKKCKHGFKCFTRKNLVNETCESKPWTGVIVCESGSGWYPSALFTEKNGYCGFNESSKYPAVNMLTADILAITKNNLQAHLPECNGFRCKLGQCIENAKVCDGVPDCRNAEDEDESYCMKRIETCNNLQNCTCSKWEMKCANGNCVPKKSFCNRVNDCGDGSDEPEMCSCKEYLKLSEPNKICDGVVHCKDNSDEQFCPCNGNNFKCERSFTCVANATICDGIYDCPTGEDEKNCFALKPFNGTVTSGEVITRTAGIWHSGCFPFTMTQRRIKLICSLLNLKSDQAKQLKVDEPEMTGRAVFDRFNVIQISRTKNHIIWLKMRSGLNPYITFRNSTNTNCYKLFVDCR